jgi:phage recombination protein Bet
MQQGMDARAYEATLRATVFPTAGSVEQLAAFLLVARKYGLDPLTKEVYAFPTRAGGIQPIVSIDGWMNLANSHPQMNGMTFKDHVDDKGKISAITCRVFRKDRDHPVEVTEYMSECFRATEPWKQWPARMLRHKATIQAIRYAFGFSGIVDQDEAERTVEGTVTLVQEPQKAIAELNAVITGKPPEPAPAEIEPTPMAGDLLQDAPSFAFVADLINRKEFDVAQDLIQSVADDQQRAELDVMLRAAKKKAK